MQKTITVKDKHVQAEPLHQLNAHGKSTAFITTDGTTEYIRYADGARSGAVALRTGVRVLARGTRGHIIDAVDKYVQDAEQGKTIPAKGKAGRIVRSGRLFGVELELVRGGNTIRKHINLATGFNLKHDGSVNGESLEIVTPPLSGTSAEYVLDKVLTPATVDAKTDTSCGMHIHVDARDFAKLDSKGKHAPLIRLVSLYMAVQPFMYSVVPHSRRANTYCKKQDATRALDALLDTNTTDGEKREYVYAYVCGDDRYQAFNLVPWYREGHYEYRLHGGTHDLRKILEWANLHTLLADSAMHKWWTPETLRELQGAGTLRALEILADTLRLTPASVSYWRGRVSQFNA